jgi:integrase
MAVRARGKILYIDFYCYLPDGRKVRCVETTGLIDNQKNRKIAESKNKAIQYELKYGRFDYFHFFPYGSKAKYFENATIDPLFSEWWDDWLAEKSIRTNTAKGWNSSYRTHIGPYFGHYRLSQISEHEVLIFRKHLESKGLKASSINDKIMKPLRMALLQADRRGILSEFPCKNIRRLKEEIPDIDPFSRDELKQFLQVLEAKKPDYYDMVFIWAYTGLRPGELCALKWKYVDYFTQKLMVRQTMHQSRSEGPPKTPHSVREIDLRPEVMQSLRRQESKTGLMDAYIFMTDANKPFTVAYMRKKFRFLLRLAGLKYRPPKQMRHTFATLHIAFGENISWVSKMLGHSSVEVTLRRYNRFIPNLTREDGSLFSKMMGFEAQKGNNLVTTTSK